MNTDAINDIKKAAEAATSGPRHVERDTEVKVDDDGITLALCDTNTAGIKEPGKDWYEEAKADAQLIALLDPATVLELCRLAEIGERVRQHMIPVATQMPPKGVTVLGLNLDGELEDVQYRDERQCMLGTRAGECGEGFVSIAAGYLPVDDITHWLPKEPQK